MNAPCGPSSTTAEAAPAFQLRPANAGDFGFARKLYMNSMQPLLSELGAWDADKADAAFEGYFIVDEIRIVTLNGTDVGWLQVSSTPTELCLDQIHLVEQARNRGVGRQLIRSIVDEAFAQGKNVSLSLVKGNPAIHLYERLGFRLTGEDETKYHMCCAIKPGRKNT